MLAIRSDLYEQSYVYQKRMDMIGRNEKFTKGAIITILMLALIALFVIPIYYAFNFNGPISDDQAVWGAFGDYMGGILNPILSFLALIAILSTLLLQRSELDITRNELELTRSELRRSASAQEKSEETLSNQNNVILWQKFDSTFSTLLDHLSRVQSRVSEPNMNRNNKESDIADLWRRSVGRDNTFDAETTRSSLFEVLGNCHPMYNFLFEFLYYVYVNIPNSEYDPSGNVDSGISNNELAEDELMYSNIIRAILLPETLHILAVLCDCKTRGDSYYRFRLLVERYRFFEKMPIVANGKKARKLIGIQSRYNSAFGNSMYIAFESLKRPD